MPISSSIPREPGRKSGAASGNPLHFLTRITARIRVIDSCFAGGGELIRVYLMASGRKGLPLAAVRSEAIGKSRHGATSDLSPLCTNERKPFVRIGAAKALAQFGGVTPAVGKTPRQTAPSPQRSSVVAHFSDTRAMLPLASRARPTARPVRATYRFAGDQTLLSGDTSVASCGNFPNHHSWHAIPHFFAE
jgi:hypothetical protein